MNASFVKRYISIVPGTKYDVMMVETRNASAYDNNNHLYLCITLDEASIMFAGVLRAGTTSSSRVAVLWWWSNDLSYLRTFHGNVAYIKITITIRIHWRLTSLVLFSRTLTLDAFYPNVICFRAAVQNSSDVLAMLGSHECTWNSSAWWQDSWFWGLHR